MMTPMERICILREEIAAFEQRVKLSERQHRELQRTLIEKKQQLADLEAETSHKVTA